MLTREFAAMGSSFELHVDAAPSPETSAALERAEAAVHALERRLSRFRPDSELSVLNRSGQAAVGADMLRLTTCALDARERTRGRFDPTVLHAVVRAGYDRSFDSMPGRVPARPFAGACGGAVTVDSAKRRITLGPGVALDLGGIAKGYAAEVACDLLHEHGPCLVNAGGDIATRGTPSAGAWAVGVETADGSVTLGIEGGGGVATSGRDRRRWTTPDGPAHHIVDPATGRPAATDVVRVTVVAGSAVDAETLATSLFVMGSRAAIDEASRRGVVAIVTTERRTVMTGGPA